MSDRGMTEETGGRRMSQTHFLFYATIAASLALSIVSAYETYLGLLDFMGRSIVGQAAAAILTFGVQVLLLAISWKIASNLREGFKANAVNWTIWFLCAFFSGYFSYYGFLETTGGRDEDIRQPRIEATIQETLLGADELLVGQLEARHQTELLDSASFQTEWQDNSLRKMIELANGAEDRIAQAARDERDQLILERQALQQRLEDTQAQVRAAEVELRLFQARVEQVQSEFERFDGRRATLEADLIEARGELTRLQVALETELLTGAGPRSRQLTIDVNTQQAVVDGILAELQDVIAALENLQPQRIEIEIQQEAGLEAQRVIELESEIAGIEAEIADVDVRLGTSNEGVQFNFDEQQGLLDQGLAALISKDYSQFDTLIVQCNQISQQLSNAGLQEDVAQINCSNQEVATVIAQLRQLQQARTSFQQECIENDEALDPRRVDGGELKFNPAIEFASECIAQTEEIGRAERNELVDTLSDLRGRRGDDVDPITMAAVALFVDRQGNAIMSAIFAIIVDVLVLLCAIVGRTVGLPERARAIDELLKMSRPYRGEKPGIEKQMDLSTLDSRKKTMVDAVINDLLRADLVEYADGDGEILLLKRNGSARLAAMRRQEIQEAADVLDAELRTGRTQTAGGPRRRRR